MVRNDVTVYQNDNVVTPGIRTLAADIFALPGLQTSFTKLSLQENFLSVLTPGVFEPFRDAGVQYLRAFTLCHEAFMETEAPFAYSI